MAGPGRGGRNAQVPQEGNPPISPGRGLPSELTSAAAGAPAGCPSCLNLAGLGKILQRLWGRAQRAATNNSLHKTPAPPQHSSLPNCSAGVRAGASWVRLGTQRGTPCHSPLLRDVTIHRQATPWSIAWRWLGPSLGGNRTHGLVTAKPVARGHHHGPSLPAALTPAALWPQHTHLGLPQRHCPLHAPTSCLVLGIGVSRRSPRPRPRLPRAPSVHAGHGRPLLAHTARGFTW